MKKIRFFMFISIFLLLVAACTPSPAPAIEPVKEDSIDEDASAVLGLCDNPYFPVSPGQELVYQFTGLDDNGEFRINFANINSEGFTAVQSFDEFEAEIKWSCEADGLVPDEPFNLNLANLPDVEIKTLEASGIGIPRADLMNVGYSWDTSFTIQVKVLSGDQEVDVEGLIEFKNMVAIIEPVSVPFGSFEEAYRVDQSGSIKMNVFGFENEIPVKNSAWYVRDVGLVKSASEAMDQSYEMVLVEVNNN